MPAYGLACDGRYLRGPLPTQFTSGSTNSMTTPGLSPNATKDAIALHLVSDLDAFAANQPTGVRDWITAQAYTATSGSFLYVPGMENLPAFVIVGASLKPCLATLGALPMALPEGQYRPATAVDELDALGWVLGAYQYTRYKDAKRKPAELVIEDSALYAALERAAQATALTRDLINAPANDMLPSHLEAASRTLAQAYDASIEVTSQRRRASSDRYALGQQKAPADYSGWQRRVLRQRWVKHQTLRRHAYHEERHGGGRASTGAGPTHYGQQATDSTARTGKCS